VNRHGFPMELPEGNVITMPHVISDMTPYESPLGTGMIDGRKARREDLKRGGCREVEPSEFRPTFRTEKWAKRFGQDVEPLKVPKQTDNFDF
jgi:hypothetical protein